MPFVDKVPSTHEWSKYDHNIVNSKANVSFVASQTWIQENLMMMVWFVFR
jgi:hypothetical protein